jgi:hypothetical protein
VKVHHHERLNKSSRANTPAWSVGAVDGHYINRPRGCRSNSNSLGLDLCSPICPTPSLCSKRVPAPILRGRRSGIAFHGKFTLLLLVDLCHASLTPGKGFMVIQTGLAFAEVSHGFGKTARDISAPDSVIWQKVRVMSVSRSLRYHLCMSDCSASYRIPMPATSFTF